MSSERESPPSSWFVQWKEVGPHDMLAPADDTDVSERDGDRRDYEPPRVDEPAQVGAARSETSDVSACVAERRLERARCALDARIEELERDNAHAYDAYRALIEGSHE